MVHEGCSSHSGRNPVSPCHLWWDKKAATIQASLDHFCKSVDSIESSKESETVPSVSGLSEIASCPPSPIVDDHSALPPPVSNSSCLFTQCQPLYANCCTVLLYFSKDCTVRLLFYFCVFFNALFVWKYCKPITVLYYIADCVRWVPRLTVVIRNKLDLQTCSQNRTHLYVGDLL